MSIRCVDISVSGGVRVRVYPAGGFTIYYQQDGTMAEDVLSWQQCTEVLRQASDLLTKVHDKVRDSHE